MLTPGGLTAAAATMASASNAASTASSPDATDAPAAAAPPRRRAARIRGRTWYVTRRGHCIPYAAAAAAAAAAVASDRELPSAAGVFLATAGGVSRDPCPVS